METQVLGKTIKEAITRALAVLFLIALFIVVLDSDLRSNVRSLMRPSYRVILAVATADLTGPGSRNQVLKVKTGDGLFVEVYGMKSGKFGPQQQLLASAKLPDKKDGYFTFNGEVTNLAVDDVDNDKKLEILATSFDNDLVAHLNVYRFDPNDTELELVHLN
jgi:hypothetical protein